MRPLLDQELAAAHANLLEAHATGVSIERVLEFAEDCSLMLPVRGSVVRWIRNRDGVYRTQQTSFLFNGLDSTKPYGERVGSATGNRTLV